MRPTARTLFGVALLALTGCEAPPPAPPVTIRIGTFQTQDLLPYFVMQEQGLDRKHGLKFVASPMVGGAAAIDAMAAGTLDLCPGVGFAPLMAAAERGLVPEKAVAVAVDSVADPKHPVVGVIVARTVLDWKDLAGKKVASNARNSTGGAAIEIRLRREGVLGYSFVEIPFANLGLAIAGGNIAAAAMYEPYLTQSLARGDGRLLGWVIGGPPFERVENTMIVSSADFHRRNPEAVKAYLRARLAAVRWINDHADEARLLLAKRLNLTAEVAAKLNLLQWATDARSDPALLEETQKVLLESGLLKRPVDPRALYDQTLLAEVLKEKR